jgi:hypothetical protein
MFQTLLGWFSQLPLLFLNPSFDQLADSAIGTLVAGLFQPLNICFDLRNFFRGQHCWTRSEEVYAISPFSSK